MDTGRDYQSYILCAFVAQDSVYPRGVHELGPRCLQYVVEAMITGWHPDLRRLLLGAVHAGHAALLPALHRYENEKRTCGRAAVRAALRTQRQGLGSNRVAVAGTRAWFRACHAIPPLKAFNLPYREQARPRVWERST